MRYRIFDKNPTGIEIRTPRRVRRIPGESRCCPNGIYTCSYCERLAGLCFSKARNLPASKNPVERTGSPRGRKPGYFINVMHNKPVRAVEDRTAPLVLEIEEILGNSRA